MRYALANSYNIPAVKVLENIGVGNFIDFAQKLGISTWKDKSRYGLSLTLGGGEVKMTDMAEAFGVLANLGYKTPLNYYLKIGNTQGDIIREARPFKIREMDPGLPTLYRTFYQTISPEHGRLVRGHLWKFPVIRWP